MNLQTELAPHHKSGLLLRNPVITAAGTFGYGIEYAKIAEIQRLGAIICKGTTLHARSGNAQPRTVETSSGMLNAIGLQNPGVRTVIKRYASVWETWQVPVIVNIAGETSGDARPAALAAASAGADAISLINTITGMLIDIETRQPVLANGTGGLSGPAVKPIALRMVYEVARELRSSHPHVPIIGIGGIT